MRRKDWIDMGRDALEQEIIEKSQERGDFVTGDDGFVIFWPEGQRGAFEAWHLRAIANELDRRNESWLKQMNEFFEKQLDKTS